MLGTIKVPPRFERLLRKSALEGALVKTLETFSWLPSRALDLFPDFTDHGPEHLSGVLTVAEELVGPRSWPHLTPDDVSVLVLAVLLHDIGMHVTTEGFAALFQGKTAHRSVSFFDDLEWNQLWKMFRTQSSRFDSRHNVELFGTPEPVEQPDLNRRNWTENQRRMAGECVRRQHARLAHEIALYGFPGPEGMEPLIIDPGFQQFGDLAGLIARSHGTNLRNCIEYLKERYNDTVRPLNIHAGFLMGLLRVSDFLQFSPGRAPNARLRVQSLRSPISIREWKKHIINVALEGEDPESVYVYCDPGDVETFLGVKNLLREFQAELDGTWAVLGEVYRGDQFALSKRRVRSNLDAKGWTPPHNKYIPIHARFNTNNPELLNCLVGPLYGYELAYGIRELIQNAIDAVRERRELGQYVQPKAGADVLVTLTRDSLIVEDCGVGMTADTVQNYFLRAGASFRTSEAWRQDFADRSGASKVLRTGRFGVGALASFLIGPRIEVTTRHWSRASGLSFQASLFDDPIEIRPTSRAIGTTIRVPLDIVRYRSLEDRCWKTETSWNDHSPFTWYRFDWPVIRIVIERQSLPIRQELRVAKVLCHDPRQSNRSWVRSEIDGMQVQWHRHATESPLVNGLEIREASTVVSGGCTIGDPARKSRSFNCWMSFWDPDGKLNIDLKRTKLSEVEGSSAVLETFAKNWIAWALSLRCSLADLLDKNKEELSWPSPFPNYWAWTESGLMLFDHELVQLLEPKRVLVTDPNLSIKCPQRSVSGAIRKRQGLPEASLLLLKIRGRQSEQYPGLEEAVEYYPQYPLLQDEGNDEDNREKGWMAKAWLKFIGKQCIPFSWDERRDVCSQAYKSLDKDVKFWTARNRDIQ